MYYKKQIACNQHYWCNTDDRHATSKATLPDRIANVQRCSLHVLILRASTSQRAKYGTMQIVWVCALRVDVCPTNTECVIMYTLARANR